MKLLSTLIGGQIGLFFTNEQGAGISLAQANAKKNDNTNKADALLANFQHEVYNVNNTVTNAAGSTTKTHETTKIAPKNFDVLREVASLNAENAILGHGINLFKDTEKRLNSMSMAEIALLTGIQMPSFTLPSPTMKSSVKGAKVDVVLDLDKIEEILAVCSDEVLVKLDAGQVFEALKNESRAAVLGKQLTKKESFLKKVLSAAKSIAVSEDISDFGIITKTKDLAYTPEEIEAFTETQARLWKEYGEVQGAVNGFKKILKDTIRAVELSLKQKHQAALTEYSQRHTEYMNANAEVQTKLQTIQQEALAELASLKIKH